MADAPLSLPDDPDLGWLRKRAKDLRRDHPEWKLADAQRVLARRFGYPSWPALKRYVELVRSYRRAPDLVPEQDDPRDEFLRLGSLTYGADDPARWAAAAAMQVPVDTVHVAASRADVAALRRLLVDGSATREGGPFAWAPLAYLAYARHDPHVTEAQVLGSARLLLEHGADPDTGYLWHGLPSPFTALTGCFGRGEGDQPPHPHGPALARTLLEAGADPNDAQTLYNRQFRRDDSHLELLFEFGLGTGDGGPWRRRLGRAAMSPAEMLGRQLGWAAVHGMDERVALLVAHGVDPAIPVTMYGVQAGSAHAAALAAGHVTTAELLASLGADATSSPEERVVAAVLAGTNPDPALVQGAIRERPGLVAWAAHHGNHAAVRRAVELGWDVDRRARTDVPSDQPWETGLHAAAGQGDREMVQLLLELGADPDVTDTRFGGTPADWAEHFGHVDLAAHLREAGRRG
ncbi:Ankyrin repeat-containing protein [Pedococcus dokdonensis]|uniref:Ankyrin repeat-containing protein n=1 Tax=Pedococcus dokdonensis TaxID=443156 RepID=A0A1H0UFF3_9MICO|nr:ankyrin repeat domain-containing protein [Pedococcus dokdonensis]SDP64765.1 Ankyrin repeat-containing protein [Pedococcus dokdonensis]